MLVAEGQAAFGIALPYSAFDKEQRVTHAAIT